MRINYVLIDLENVQPASLAGLEADFFKVLIFVGASQTKIPFELASAAQRLGERASYIKIAGNGINALDFHIAYYIGRPSARSHGVLPHHLQRHRVRYADSTSESTKNRCSQIQRHR